MIDVNRKGEVWVFAEQHNGQLEDTPIELMGKARQLADKLDVKLAAALLGDNVNNTVDKLIHFGADKVYLVEHPLLQSRNRFSQIDQIPVKIEQRVWILLLQFYIAMMVVRVNRQPGFN